MSKILDNNVDDIYKMIEVKNVSSIEYNTDNTMQIITDTIETTSTTILFLLDTPQHEAFGHWVFESAIYLPLLQKSQIKYNNLKIVSPLTVPYKKLFFDYFKITSNIIIPSIEEKNNISYIPNFEICSLNRGNYLQEYTDMLKLFLNFFTPSYQVLKYINTLVLPRHKKFNFKIAERTVDTSDIENNLSLDGDDKVFDSSSISTLNEQINMIRCAKNIIVPDGSAALVNGIFAINSKIIIICGEWARMLFLQSYFSTPKLYPIINHIRKINTLIFVLVPEKNPKEHKFMYNDIQEFTSNKWNGENTVKITTNMYLKQPYEEIPPVTVGQFDWNTTKTCPKEYIEEMRTYWKD